jgi:hypothetical protein
LRKYLFVFCPRSSMCSGGIPNTSLIFMTYTSLSPHAQATT